MKRLLFPLLLFFVIFPTISTAGDSLDLNCTNELTKPSTNLGTIPFITTWRTWGPGSSNGNQIIIPTATGETYNYTVDWGDGNTSTGETGDAIHTYATPGNYTVSITGLFPRIAFDASDDQEKLLTIEQWGNNQWTSMEDAFNGCPNMTGNFNDTPDLSIVTSMVNMFTNCRLFNSEINNWNVSNITDMTGLFTGARSFNRTLNNWNVSNVTSMQNMFSRALSFNQDIRNWNTSNVNNMSLMFNGADAFNQDISFKSGLGFPAGSAWDTSNVTTMEGMFWDALAFNQDIGNWNVGNVTNMSKMFNNASVFNQNIGIWNVHNVTNMVAMFYEASVFNQDLKAWDVSNVTSMRLMFFNAGSFNQDISGWDVTNVTELSYMFWGASSFDQNLGTWNVENVTTALSMFSGVTLSTTNYDSLLIAWNAQNLQPNVPFGGGNSQYCDGATARANMIASDNWTITDGGLAGPEVNDLTDQNHANSYTLPTITGTQLTGSEAYYTATNWRRNGL